MLLDTHAHYDDEAFDADRDVLLEDLKEYGIRKVINAGASVESSYTGLKLAERYPWMYAALGAHPNYVEELNETVLKDFAELTKHPKVVAIGEIGLEYHYEEPARDIQKIWFRRQLDLAAETGLPVIIHSREAAQDTFDEMQRAAARGIGGVIHCFSSGAELACRYTDLGFYIGIGGVVTFKNGKKMKEVAAAVPLSSILLETDSPYLAPEPNRGKRNDSRNLTRIAEEIAHLRGISAEEVQRVTEENALRCFPKLANEEVG